MEHRAFHYGALTVIGAAHLGLLMLASNHTTPVTPPQLLPIEMVSINEAPQPTAAAAPQRVTPVVPKQLTPQPAAVKPIVTPSVPRQVTSNAPSVPAPSQPAPAPSSPSTAATETTNHAANVEQAAVPEKVAVTPPSYEKGSYLNNPKPEYPPLSLELGEEGTVYLRIAVNSKGRATAVSVARSSGFPRLDSSARRAAAGWSYSPAMRGDEPIDDTFTAPIKFVLPNKTKA
ncbi:energy transducer TonB [Vogesella sp. GCM10023246]|uniref:TonB family protein n=1 Tax=Vogesella oryzagri TaxID=3160864 RepID=A0ABV1M909_9NEIS